MVLYPLAEGDRLATCSQNGVALLARVQHEVSVAEETMGEVKLTVIRYVVAKKAQGNEMTRRL